VKTKKRGKSAPVAKPWQTDPEILRWRASRDVGKRVIIVTLADQARMAKARAKVKPDTVTLGVTDLMRTFRP